MNEMTIAFCTDVGYWSQTVVAIESILTYSKKNENYVIYILLQENPITIQICNVEELEKKYSCCKINLIVASQYFTNLRCHIPDITEPTYYRLLLPELLEENRCLYLDSDVIVCENINRLYNMDLDGYEIAGVIAPSVVVYKDRNYDRSKNIGVPDMNTYVNAGVLMFNLDELRKNNFSYRVRNVINMYFETQDQDIINKLCYGKIKLIPFKYNTDVEYYPCENRMKLRNTCLEEQAEDAYAEPSIIHYSGKFKPWEFPEMELSSKWWNVSNKSILSTYFNNKYSINWVNKEWINKNNLSNKDILSKEVISFLKNYTDIFIYGAGNYAKSIIDDLSSVLDIRAILVTSTDNNANQINEIPIIEFQSIADKLNDDSIILVATGRNLFPQIRRAIFQKGIYKVLGFEK